MEAAPVVLQVGGGGTPLPPPPLPPFSRGVGTDTTEWQETQRSHMPRDRGGRGSGGGPGGGRGGDPRKR